MSLTATDGRLNRLKAGSSCIHCSQSCCATQWASMSPFLGHLPVCKKRQLRIWRHLQANSSLVPFISDVETKSKLPCLHSWPGSFHHSTCETHAACFAKCVAKCCKHCQKGSRWFQMVEETLPILLNTGLLWENAWCFTSASLPGQTGVLKNQRAKENRPARIHSNHLNKKIVSHCVSMYVSECITKVCHLACLGQSKLAIALLDSTVYRLNT